MPYQSSELLFSHFRDNNIDLSNIDAQLQLVAPNSPNLPLYRDMMLTILRMAHDDTDRWSAKITLQALLAEMRADAAEGRWRAREDEKA